MTDIEIIIRVGDKKVVMRGAVQDADADKAWELVRAQLGVAQAVERLRREKG